MTKKIQKITKKFTESLFDKNNSSFFCLLHDWRLLDNNMRHSKQPPLSFIFSYIRSYYRDIVGQKPVFGLWQILEPKYIHITRNNGNGKVQRNVSLRQTEACAT